MSYLPAPYESPKQDDLSATLSAILTSTVGLLTSWNLGRYVYPLIRQYIDGLRGELDPSQQAALTATLKVFGVPTVGWTVAAVLMIIGSVLLLFRRGRGWLVLGALVSIGTTGWAQFGVGMGGPDATYPVDQWPLYWGGVAVLVLVLLPATGRWVGRQARVRKPSAVIGTTETGAVLWPGT